jgi:hypothetical protein
MSKRTQHGLAGALGALLLMLAGTTWAQDSAPTGSAQDAGTMGQMHPGQAGMSGMRGMHDNVMGRHTMPATVNSVDKQTGVVEVASAGMTLRLHFPPSALTDLKAGDRITVHMAYSKP